MNRDAVENLAKEIAPDYYNDASHVSTDIIFLQDFASRIESIVREECAKQCEEYSRVGLGLNSCAAAIRKSEG
jgi:hypothetical protein